MAKEIEFKFLAKSIPGKPQYHVRIHQGYVFISKEKQVRVRVDLTHRKAWMCIKFHNKNSREEFETEMNFEEGLELYALCKYRVAKSRFSLYHGQYKLDFDLYEDGTQIVEVEVDQKFIEKYEDPIKEIQEDLSQYVGENVDGQWKYNNYYFAGFPENEYK
jgi:CYTH domain-containing protein